MPYDALLMFSDGQAITVDAPSTDVLDLGIPSINPRSPTGARFPNHHGDGCSPKIVIKVGTTFVGATGLTIQLQGSDDNSTWATIGSISPAAASLVAGAEFGIDVARGHGFRYLRLNYDGTGTITAGTITAGYADGYQTAGTF